MGESPATSVFLYVIVAMVRNLLNVLFAMKKLEPYMNRLIPANVHKAFTMINQSKYVYRVMNYVQLVMDLFLLNVLVANSLQVIK